ncbi:UDP-N-acetylmuramate--L-alanine ligase [bacterium 1xD42-67]|nr:UDP-N-acetylmuramate--L-alanine ligase [bacterium 1xD42-67]
MNRNIEDYIRPGAWAHLVGIGGVSMAPLAEVLKGKGVAITGSDTRESEATVHLQSLGIPVTIGHRPEQVEGAGCIIRTAAVHDDDPEIAAALAAGIPVFERAQAWGALMRHYENALCVAGTHGKTTTTSMCAHIFLAAGRDPSVMIGGTLPILGCGHRVGHGDTIIAESCEYCNSFLSFAPTVAVILNVEEDHLDFFRDLEDIERSFRQFAELVPSGGRVIVNADNAGARRAVQGLEVFTFGLDEGAECTAGDLAWERGLPSFDILVHGERYASVSLQVGGKHNVSNALAAAAAAYVLGVPGRAVEEGLASFTGAGRRFEKKGAYHGADVYDDYAHHPDELRALLAMARTLGYERVICAFQPHTYTRTAALFDQFVEALELADVVVLAEIYAARETNDLGISSMDLVRKIPGGTYCPDLEGVTARLAELARPGDLILTVGAGDIYLAGEALLEMERPDRTCRN